MSDEFDTAFVPPQPITGGGSNKSSSSSSDTSFLNYVFRFDAKTKNELSNIIQYIVLAIIPIIVFNKMTAHVIPEFDETKDSINLLFEVIGQLILTILGMFITHRIVTYFPTYSNTQYPDVQLIYVILVFLTITMGLQTNVGNKVNVLATRFTTGVNNFMNGGAPHLKQHGGGGGEMYISQPISGNGMMINEPPQYIHQGNNTPIQYLPNMSEQMTPHVQDQRPNQQQFIQEDTSGELEPASGGTCYYDY